jgi:hypothetical protein
MDTTNQSLDAAGDYINRRRTDRAADTLCVCSDKSVMQITAELEERAYWRRYNRLLVAETNDRSTAKRKAVTLPSLNFGR